ncbi:MAG: ABC transporter ATP-binding protein [Bacteroidetes bacterium]|nr:MAG: ABC transporter ATP-binding protein [Bacteroidota bacterium]
MALLEVRNISKTIADKIIIEDISFEQEEFHKLAIAGASGSGKTTLLKMISGHLQPTNGTILFDGERVEGPDEKLLPGHKQIAYLSQHYELLNNYRVDELIWYENKLPESEATRLFEICKIDRFLQRRTNQLSGGEKQRIALCMLLIKKPKMLVLDEPFSNLDPMHTEILKTVLEDISENLKITCTLASHDPNDTLPWADKIIVIKDGKFLQQGSPLGLYHKPMNEYVAGLFGKYNSLKPQIAFLFGIVSKEKNVITRPEHFRISSNGSGVNGIISKIHFRGSFYDVEVLVDNAKITVKNDGNQWAVGDKIFLSLK